MLEFTTERNQVERAIKGLKCFRLVATRFNKRAANYVTTGSQTAELDEAFTVNTP